MFRGTADHDGDFRRRPAPAWDVAWSVELGERIDASAVITGDERVIVATRSGSVVALALADGTERGRVRLGGGVWASPALVGDVLIVAAKDRTVYGLDARALEQRWTIAAPSASFSAITAVGARAYLVSGEELFAIDPDAGEVTWRRPIGAPSFTAPAYDTTRELLVIATRAGQVKAYDLAGNVRWDSPTTPGAHNDGSPAIAGELVLVGSNDYTLYAFALTDGARQWTVLGQNWVVSTPAVGDNVAYYGDDGGAVRAVSTTVGEVLWTGRVGGDVASSPTLVGELLIHGAHDGKLHAWRPASGEALEPIELGASAYASVAVAADGTAVIGTHAGRVVAVR